MASCKQRVLIVAPSLDLKKNVSGVSAVTNFIIENNKDCKYEHFLQGKSDGESGALQRVYRIWLNYRHWTALLKKNDDLIIHYNYPLDALSIIRDYIFLRTAHNYGRKMVIHIHGGLYLFKNKKPYIISKILNKVFSWDYPFIVLSAKEKELIQKVYHSKRIYVLPNCVNLPSIIPQTSKLKPQDTIHILYIGRIEPNKGIEYLYEAMKELKMQNIILHFAGIEQGEKNYIERFKELLKDQFVYEGIVSGKQKTDLLKHCNIFVLPSLYEGLPISLLECMSYGVVPVVTNVGSIDEYVTNGENGIFIEKKSATSIVLALNMLLTDINMIHKLSAAAQRTIYARLQPEKYINKLNHIYSAIV